jgi:hypothetical protein
MQRHRSGVRCIALRCGGSPPADLAAADALFDNPAALVSALKQTNLATLLSGFESKLNGRSARRAGAYRRGFLRIKQHCPTMRSGSAEVLPASPLQPQRPKAAATAGKLERSLVRFRLDSAA